LVPMAQMASAWPAAAARQITAHPARRTTPVSSHVHPNGRMAAGELATPKAADPWVVVPGGHV